MTKEQISAILGASIEEINKMVEEGLVEIIING